MDVTEAAEKIYIPVTNLDELSVSPELKKQSLHLDCTNARNVKDNAQASVKQVKSQSLGGKNHFCPIKKVDYNAARELITPKVYFEKPVGLRSAISPKGKNSKVSLFAY